MSYCEQCAKLENDIETLNEDIEELSREKEELGETNNRLSKAIDNILYEAKEAQR